MSSSPAPRPRPLGLLIGAALVIAAACLLSWAAFNVARGPSECGGSGAPACPSGFVAALIGGFVAGLVLAPIGVGLVATRVRGTGGAALALLCGGVTAGVYVARFEAAPVTDATVPTWILTGGFGLVALLALLASLIRTLTPGSGPPAPASRRAADRSPGVPPAATPEPAATAATAGAEQLQALLSHGLVTGALGRDDAIGGADPATRKRIAHLVELHQQGVIGDEDLREGLRALRETGSAGAGHRGRER